MTTTAAEALMVLRDSDCLHDANAVASAVQAMADRLNDLLSDEETVALCVMTGGVVLAGQLLPMLRAPLQLDYVHATRYRGDLSGSEIAWLKQEETPLAYRNVLIIDDILDEGYTLEAIHRHCKTKGAGRVISAVLTEKRHERSCGYHADVVGLTVPDRYVFGAGMDYKGYLRNLPSIHAVSETT
jgi:hypoxanthine phosphoribosyltransferase